MDTCLLLHRHHHHHPQEMRDRKCMYIFRLVVYLSFFINCMNQLLQMLQLFRYEDFIICMANTVQSSAIDFESHLRQFWVFLRVSCLFSRQYPPEPKICDPSPDKVTFGKTSEGLENFSSPTAHVQGRKHYFFIFPSYFLHNIFLISFTISSYLLHIFSCLKF